ncbi:unnamed protein product [Porites lobata]|uniref:Uncharacterized protein n=1 Tax=Porites lobata TaxID=104759 RepID=A0ABN8S2C9_9CNID|nr:unnamed protein product [Porites lobata]
MPPAKRTTAPQARRSKRLQADLSEAGPSSVAENPPMPQQQTGQGGEIQGGQGAMQLDVRALTSTISLAVAQAVKDAMAAHQATVSSTVTPTPSAAVEQVVQNEVLSYTTGTTKQALLPALLGVGDQPRPSHPFSSIAVNLGSRVSAKIKAKIWANEYTDFGALLSIAPSRKVCSFHGFQWGCCKSTTVNSRALHTPKKVTNISQWLTAFNTFVSIYSVKCSQDAPKLMK